MDNKKIMSDNIQEIVTNLVEVSNKYFEYEEAKKNILSTYRGTVLDNELSKLQDETIKAATVRAHAMTKAAEKIHDAVGEGNAYDVNDDAVSNAAMLLSKPDVSSDAVVAVLEGFKGNQIALKLIKGSAHETYQDIIDRFIFDNIKAVDDIMKVINELEYEKPENYPSIVSMIRSGLIDFASHQGIDVTTSQEVLEDMRTRNIAGMMGLKPEQYEK